MSLLLVFKLLLLVLTAVIAIAGLQVSLSHNEGDTRTTAKAKSVRLSIVLTVCVTLISLGTTVCESASNNADAQRLLKLTQQNTASQASLLKQMSESLEHQRSLDQSSKLVSNQLDTSLTSLRILTGHAKTTGQALQRSEVVAGRTQEILKASAVAQLEAKAILNVTAEKGRLALSELNQINRRQLASIQRLDAIGDVSASTVNSLNKVTSSSQIISYNLVRSLNPLLPLKAEFVCEYPATDVRFASWFARIAQKFKEYEGGDQKVAGWVSKRGIEFYGTSESWMPKWNLIEEREAARVLSLDSLSISFKQLKPNEREVLDLDSSIPQEKSESIPSLIFVDFVEKTITRLVYVDSFQVQMDLGVAIGFADISGMKALVNSSDPYFKAVRLITVGKSEKETWFISEFKAEEGLSGYTFFDDGVRVPHFMGQKILLEPDLKYIDSRKSHRISFEDPRPFYARWRTGQ